VDVVSPNWAHDFGIQAFTTTRNREWNQEPCAAFNLSAQPGHTNTVIAPNLELCLPALKLPQLPRWLHQVHGSRTVDVTDLNSSFEINADAIYTHLPDHVCGILTADCLPIVICDQNATEIAVVHAGWRGLLCGVIESSLRKFSTPATRLIAWIGPGISRQAYTVDPSFRRRFIYADAAFDRAFFFSNGKWHADLYAIAEMRLNGLGVTDVACYDGCTFSEPDRFYSNRRDGVTGRMATIAWIDSGTSSTAQQYE